MLNLNLKARLENKTFWISLVAAIILLLQQCGLNASQFIPSNYVEIINSIFAILTILGIVIDTSTPGVSDQAIANATIQVTNANTQETVKTEATTTSINNTITENSASSKITVDNPDNNVTIGQEVNAVNADTPQ